jgi:hypothetical protein
VFEEGHWPYLSGLARLASRRSWTHALEGPRRSIRRPTGRLPTVQTDSQVIACWQKIFAIRGTFAPTLGEDRILQKQKPALSNAPFSRCICFRTSNEEYAHAVIYILPNRRNARSNPGEKVRKTRVSFVLGTLCVTITHK